MDEARIAEIRMRLLQQGLCSRMAARLLKDSCRKEGRQNVIVSPLSVLMLLAVASEATAGRTRDEIISIMGGPHAGEALSALQTALCAGGVLSSANAVCVRQDKAGSVKEEFREQLGKKYGGEVFASENLTEDVDAWITEKTRGMIRNAAPEGMENLLMCLVNAVAFDDKWRTEYEDSDVRDGVFHNADGTESTVSMLNGVEYDYIDEGGFRGFLKEYRNGYSFLGLLPKEEGAEALEAAVGRISFDRLIRRKKRMKVYTRLPEFTFDYTRELIPMLRESGIEQLFTFDADFSPALADTRVKVGSVTQKAFIEVNRQGTRAAAVTAMWAEAECAAPEEEYEEVFLDRPFVFAILHKGTVTPVFTGIVNRLENKA